jgi:hypothetical protein
MAYQTKVTTGYGTRLKNSLGGMATGAIMFILATILLFLNEGFYVKRDKAIRETKKVLVKVSDISAVDPALNGRVIHANGSADTQEVLNDALFGVSANAICISRRVEYFQYREFSSTEKKDKVGGGQETITTYTYHETWTSSPINSGSFKDPAYKDSNFVLTTVDKNDQLAKDVSFGAYKLPVFIVDSIGGSVPAEINLGSAERSQWENQIAKNMDALGKKKDGNMVNVQGNMVYFGKSSATPAIGDVRVTLTKITPPADVSIIAKVVGNTFEKYIASNGWEFPNPVENGIVSADTMIAHAQSSNNFITWLLRLLGLILVVVGLKLLFGLLPTLLKVLPPLGAIVGAGIGLVCAVGGFAWTLGIIAIAWLFYRPLIAVPMIAIAVGGIVMLTKMKSKKQAVVTSAVSATWDCECGQKANAGKFCSGCGKPQPEPVSATWDCACGHKANTGKFCAECGKPRP